jgi:hypothetical protein
VARGALRLARAARGAFEPLIAGCPVLWERISAISLIDRVIGFEWRADGLILPLLPSSPELFIEAVTNELGREPGRALLTDYAAAVAAGRCPQHRRLTAGTLTSLLQS